MVAKIKYKTIHICTSLMQVQSLENMFSCHLFLIPTFIIHFYAALLYIIQFSQYTKAWEICGIQALNLVNDIRDSSSSQKVKQKLTFAKHSENPEKEKRKDILSAINFCYIQDC